MNETCKCPHVNGVQWHRSSCELLKSLARIIARARKRGKTLVLAPDVACEVRRVLRRQKTTVIPDDVRWN